MNRDRILSVLYDLTLTIGREVEVGPLLTRVLQRLLFHTSCPVGLVLDHRQPAVAAGRAVLAKAIGDHVLMRQVGEELPLPTGLPGGRVEIADSAAVLAGLAGSRPYGFCLKLPVGQDYTIVLLAPAPPAAGLPLTDIFQPVLANLARTLRLCRDSEELARKLRHQRNAARAELVRAQKFNEALLKAIPVPIFYKDIRGCYLGCNPAFSRLLGVAEQDIQGKTVSEIWPATMAGVYQGMDEDLIRTCKPQSYEYMVRDHQGENRSVFYAKDVFYDDRNQVAGIIGAFVDMTERKRAEESLRRTLIQTIDALSSAMMHRDPFTAGHEKRVSDLALAIGQKLAFDEERLKGLGLAAMVHDIGNIQTPAEILTRPRQLTPEEFDLVKLHAEASHDILKDIHFPWPIAQVALQHHENFDGSGYPQGLKGDAILLEARILRVADSLEAMLSHRPFRRQFDVAHAMAELRTGRGTLYDPQVADVCLHLIEECDYVFPHTSR